MHLDIQLALAGLGQGALLAVFALGLVSIHNGSGILNLGHGAIATFTAYVFLWMVNDLGVPTALAFLAWFVFAPQCLSTIAVTRRETNGWKWPAFMLGYLFALAYIFAGLTYWAAVALGL